MTSQTKLYIELSDILAVRCECKRCGATVSLPFANNVRTEGLWSCPNCKEDWTVFGQGRMSDSIDPTIKSFMDSLTKLDEALRGIKERGGFVLSLEVRKEADSKTSASREVV